MNLETIAPRAFVETLRTGVSVLFGRGGDAKAKYPVRKLLAGDTQTDSRKVRTFVYKDIAFEVDNTNPNAKNFSFTRKKGIFGLRWNLVYLGQSYSINMLKLSDRKLLWEAVDHCRNVPYGTHALELDPGVIPFKPISSQSLKNLIESNQMGVVPIQQSINYQIINTKFPPNPVIPNQMPVLGQSGGFTSQAAGTDTAGIISLITTIVATIKDIFGALNQLGITKRNNQTQTGNPADNIGGGTLGDPLVTDQNGNVIGDSSNNNTLILVGAAALAGFLIYKGTQEKTAA